MAGPDCGQPSPWPIQHTSSSAHGQSSPAHCQPNAEPDQPRSDQPMAMLARGQPSPRRAKDMASPAHSQASKQPALPMASPVKPMDNPANCQPSPWPGQPMSSSDHSQHGPVMVIRAHGQLRPWPGPLWPTHPKVSRRSRAQSMINPADDHTSPRPALPMASPDHGQARKWYASTR
jgi:hypothetical protein